VFGSKKSVVPIEMIDMCLSFSIKLNLFSTLPSMGLVPKVYSSGQHLVNNVFNYSSATYDAVGSNCMGNISEVLQNYFLQNTPTPHVIQLFFNNEVNRLQKIKTGLVLPSLSVPLSASESAHKFSPHSYSHLY